ncbi:MAG: PrsW family intramembrane metalloprotease [Anaerovibrio sp.]|uniref:PrsW family intramembrane metalloprotease n=1 Tax=Anaerovibrio sp. TaxID=1872532 RepID=UPI0025BEEBD0|nr:PrsW family glutamic-type intramembrane protease [Anaerovibrio sp.]MBE6099842.1 PrsW family intramembrane metalloprotease [Anaerovibrio sp.]
MDDILMAVTVLPGLAFVYYIYQLDKKEKEPTDLLVKLLGLGALSCIPVVIFELLAEKMILEEFLYPGTVEYAFVEAFLGVALIEEFAKLYVLKKFTWTHPAFTHHFDAIVYAVCVSMGFAILENIFYVLDGGFTIAFSRAVTSIPGHGVFGIFMGIYYGYAKEQLHRMQRQQKDENLRIALIMPTLLHGFYDFCILTEDETMMGIFLIFIIVLYVIAFIKVREMSKQDHQIYY